MKGAIVINFQWPKYKNGQLDRWWNCNLTYQCKYTDWSIQNFPESDSFINYLVVKQSIQRMIARRNGMTNYIIDISVSSHSHAEWFVLPPTSECDSFRDVLDTFLKLSSELRTMQSKVHRKIIRRVWLIIQYIPNV